MITNNHRRLLPQNQPRTRCRRGHPLTDANVIVNPATGKRRCRACRNDSEQHRKRRQWRATHAEHETRRDSAGGLRCLTCIRGDLDVDEVAVWRAVTGDPPARMTLAETEAAVYELTRRGLGAGEIGSYIARNACTVKRVLAELQHRHPDTSWRTLWG